MVGPVSDLLAKAGYFLFAHRASRGDERKGQSVGSSWRTRTHHAAFSQFVCSSHRPAPPLLHKRLLTTEKIMPATASYGKTIAASRLLSEHFGKEIRIFIGSTDFLLEGL
jgi:hypothetical protein